MSFTVMNFVMSYLLPLALGAFLLVCTAVVLALGVGAVVAFLRAALSDDE